MTCKDVHVLAPGTCGIYDLTGQKGPCSCVKDLETRRFS